MAITRSDVEGIVNFLETTPDGATRLEREALAAYQADPDAAIARALTPAEPAGEVETFVMFTRECPHCGAPADASGCRIPQHDPRCPTHDPNF